jgi:uncharacterized protein YndB with AHSA1/START domain
MSSRMNIVMARRDSDAVIQYRASPEDYAYIGASIVDHNGDSPMAEPLVVRRETHIPAPPAAVFAFLTDPEKILRWMGTEAQLEPQPGGIYLVNVTGARFARGAFREVVPVHRLAYSFGWDGGEVVPPGSSTVEIDLIEQPDGTLLRLTHTGLPNAEQCAGHAEGWAHYIGRLAQVAAGRDPGPDPWHGRKGPV